MYDVNHGRKTEGNFLTNQLYSSLRDSIKKKRVTFLDI